MKNIKKTLSLLLTVVMLMSMTTTAFATTNYNNGTQVTYNGTGTESYTVTVPAELNPGESGDVTVSGTWANNRVLTVTADSIVTLTNSINTADKKVLDVTFVGIELVGSNTTAVSETKTVSVADIEDALFGAWSGVFNYDVEMIDNASTITITCFRCHGDALSCRACGGGDQSCVVCIGSNVVDNGECCFGCGGDPDCYYCKGTNECAMICLECDGTGQITGIPCSDCAGLGETNCVDCNGSGRTCMMCSGAWDNENNVCSVCGSDFSYDPCFNCYRDFPGSSTGKFTCDTCNGKGIEEDKEEDKEEDDTTDETVTCSNCNGLGYFCHECGEPTAYTEMTACASWVDPCSICEGTGKVSGTGEDDNQMPITFTIDGITYQAEAGMTWKEWVNSDYNPAHPEQNEGNHKKYEIRSSYPLVVVWVSMDDSVYALSYKTETGSEFVLEEDVINPNLQYLDVVIT